MKVVWDFGGVLFHWRPPALLKRELPHRAPDDASAALWVERIFQGFGGDWAAFDRGTLGVPELVDRTVARTGLAATEVRRVIDGVPNALQPMPDSLALVDGLRARGWRQCYLSNMPAPYADHLEREHAFVRAFEAGVFSARVAVIKPEPGIYELAARRFGVPPGQLLFFDDTLENVHAARAAGWHAEHFTGAAEAEAALRRHGLW